MKSVLVLSLIYVALIVVGLLLLGYRPAYSAVVQMYTPGGAPCAGACDQEWAEKRFGVPHGEPKRLTIPAGSMVSQMSYAKDGVPYAINMTAMLAQDEPGEGYLFETDGITFMMVKLDVCQNWAVMLPPAVAVPFAKTSVGPQTEALRQPWTPPAWGGGGGIVHTPPDGPPVIVEPPVEPPQPSPVPLGRSILMLIMALGSLALTKGKSYVQSL